VTGSKLLVPFGLTPRAMRFLDQFTWLRRMAVSKYSSRFDLNLP
jgi:hypothetical protein